MWNFNYHFHEFKKKMNSYIYIFAILIIGFITYFLLKDKIFENSEQNNIKKTETFEIPAPASIEIRQAPIYPERVIMPSGPNPPSQQAPQNEVVVYGEPQPKDPYYENQESSDIPENLRYPERSFRSPPLNNNTSIAVEAGIASNNIQVSSDNSQKFNPEFIQGGGEFMPGIFANDTFSDTNYSAY
jgi:hypothetical protein